MWSHGYDAGYQHRDEIGAEFGRPVVTHLRDQLDAALAEIARRDAEDAEHDAEYLEHVRAGNRGDTRSHLQVLVERGARPAEIARAQVHHDRVWATPATTTTREAAA